MGTQGTPTYQESTHALQHPHGCVSWAPNHSCKVPGGDQRSALGAKQV